MMETDIEYEYRWEYFNADGTLGITKQYFSFEKADNSVLREGSYFRRPHKPSKRPKAARITHD
jgi:hypothetical protein